MNKVDTLFPVGGEARLRYGNGDYQVLKPGGFVRCAVTGAMIPLAELKYWSVDLQEAYATPEASLKRYAEIRARKKAATAAAKAP